MSAIVCITFLEEEISDATPVAMTGDELITDVDHFDKFLWFTIEDLKKNVRYYEERIRKRKQKKFSYVKLLFRKIQDMSDRHSIMVDTRSIEEVRELIEPKLFKTRYSKVMDQLIQNVWDEEAKRDAWEDERNEFRLRFFSENSEECYRCHIGICDEYDNCFNK